jgi:hypothetical protein
MARRRRRRLTLASLVLALGAGCYEPEMLDCTITCEAPGDDCADGQVCGSDHLCAAPDLAGHCQSYEAQASVVTIEVVINGDGSVSVDGVGSCDSRTATASTCRFTATREQPLQLTANKSGAGEFERWKEACAGALATCVITPVMALTRVRADFD